MSSSAAAQKGPGRSRSHSCGVSNFTGLPSRLERDPLRMVGNASSGVGTVLQPVTQAPLAFRRGGMQKQGCSCPLDSPCARCASSGYPRAHEKRHQCLLPCTTNSKKSAIRRDLHQPLEQPTSCPPSKKQIYRTTGQASPQPSAKGRNVRRRVEGRDARKRVSKRRIERKRGQGPRGSWTRLQPGCIFKSQLNAPGLVFKSRS